MPKRLIQQRRGKGGPRFTSPGHRFKGATVFRKMDEDERKSIIKGIVKDIYNDPAKTSPMVLIEFDNKEIICYPAPIGIKVGDSVESGAKSSVKIGNILHLSNIPDGTLIYCVENKYGSGPKFARTGGNSAKLIAHEDKGVVVQLPSKKNVILSGDCRAVIGKIAGSGRKEKPFVKAANKKKARNAKGKKHAKVTGATMNAIDHPHGGGGVWSLISSEFERLPASLQLGVIQSIRTRKGLTENQ